MSLKYCLLNPFWYYFMHNKMHIYLMRILQLYWKHKNLQCMYYLISSSGEIENVSFKFAFSLFYSPLTNTKCALFSISEKYNGKFLTTQKNCFLNKKLLLHFLVIKMVKNQKINLYIFFISIEQLLRISTI